MPETQYSTSVLVVGGGPVGLTALLLLASRNIPAILVERHASSSPHPRAIGFTARSLEIYRALGLGEKIPQVPPGMAKPRRIAVESLAGKWHNEQFWSAEQESANTDPDEAVRKALKVSPCTGAGIAQDRLEPILRDRAAELGADIRMRTELVSFTQDEAGITASVRDRDGGQEYDISAKYMIAADGHASPVREALGIDREGQGYLSTVRSVLFCADLDKYLAAGISQFDVVQPDFAARLVTYRDGRWALMFEDDEERDAEQLKKLASRAIGDPDVDIQLITTGRWELSALIANRFSEGRVLLAGDAAHTFPPARGGFGANTGIEDVHNLVWKLGAVLSGTSKPSLLETYDAERRAIAWLRHGQIFNREDYEKFAKPADKDVPIYEDEGMELGQLYRSAAVLGAGEDLPPAQAPEKWHGQPGTRAPHLWVWRDGKRVSTLDLVHSDWLLLTTDARWRPVAGLVGSALRMTLACVLIGAEGAPEDTGATAMSLDTPIEQIMSVPAGRALLEAQIPEISGHADYGRFKGMSLKKLQPLAPKQLTPDKLAKIDTGLAGLEVPAAATMSLDTPIEQIFASAAGKAVIEAHIPEIPGHPEYARFKSMNLRQLQPLAAKQLTAEKLARVEAGLATIPCGPVAAQEDAETIRREFCKVFGIGSDGASLIRPDGYVAWRSVDLPPDAVLKLSEALASVAATSAKP